MLDILLCSTLHSPFLSTARRRSLRCELGYRPLRLQPERTRFKPLVPLNHSHCRFAAFPAVPGYTCLRQSAAWSAAIQIGERCAPNHAPITPHPAGNENTPRVCMCLCVCFPARATGNKGDPNSDCFPGRALKRGIYGRDGTGHCCRSRDWRGRSRPVTPRRHEYDTAVHATGTRVGPRACACSTPRGPPAW